MRLVIELKNEEEMRFVKELLARLQIGTVPAEPATATNGNHPVRILEAIAARGTAGNAIENPAAWQREMRQDRELPFRD
jgi:hypothetical protein